MLARFALVLGAAVFSTGCPGVPRPAPAVAQNREITAFAQAASWPNAEPLIAIVAAQEFVAAHHAHDGYEYFGRLAREQPQRPILLSLEGMLQASVAEEIPLLRRVAWVEEAIGKLDRGAQADPRAGRLLRGLVFAALPERIFAVKPGVELDTVSAPSFTGLPASSTSPSPGSKPPKFGVA